LQEIRVKEQSQDASWVGRRYTHVHLAAAYGIWEQVDHPWPIAYGGKYRPDVLGSGPTKLGVRPGVNLPLFP
jgi:hypothetical protein